MKKLSELSDTMGTKLSISLKSRHGTTSVTIEEIRKYKESLLGKDISFYRWFHLLGSLVAVLSVGLLILSLWSTWLHTYNPTEYHATLWDICLHNDTFPPPCPVEKPYWQSAVVGLAIFSAAFGSLAAILSICGVCKANMPKKIYFYHSAGEIYLVCALACTAGLVVFPVAVEFEDKMVPHRYGAGYGLCWGSAFFLFASALCMCLDDLVKTIARGLCQCCDKNDGSDLGI